jgi:hypothetical protein
VRARVVASQGYHGALSIRDMDGSGNGLKRAIKANFKEGDEVVILRRADAEILGFSVSTREEARP